MQGYLEKQTSSVLFRKFQLRYFLQRRALLVYYLRLEDVDGAVSEPKGQIDLSQCIAVGITEGDEIAREFWIELPERTYWFRAPNTEDRDCWIANLFAFNGASASGALPIARHVYMALITAITSLTSDSGDVEGLFRVPGVKNVVDRTCDAIYRLQTAEAFAANDVTVFELASVVKKLLRELPESVLTEDLILPFTSMSATAESVRDLVEKLPLQNREILMKLSVLIYRQFQMNTVTKASSKSLSILLGPCLSMNMDAPFLDITKLISILVEQGSIVFGYSFSRAVALQIRAAEQSVTSTAKQDPWVNQELEKETIAEKKAVAHLTEIEPMADLVVEVEHFAPAQTQQENESLRDPSDNEVAGAIDEQPTSRPSATNHLSTAAIQTRFNAQEFGLSSGSEMSPREDDEQGHHRRPDAVKPTTENSSSPKSIVRLQPIRRGRHSIAVQRKNILSMGNTSESDNDGSQSRGLSLRMRRLSVAQGRPRNACESAGPQTSITSDSILSPKLELYSKSDTAGSIEKSTSIGNPIVIEEGRSIVGIDKSLGDSMQHSHHSSRARSKDNAPSKESCSAPSKASGHSTTRGTNSTDPVVSSKGHRENDADALRSIRRSPRSRSKSPRYSKGSDHHPTHSPPAGKQPLVLPFHNSISSGIDGESQIVKGPNSFSSVEAKPTSEQHSSLVQHAKSTTNYYKSSHSRNDQLKSNSTLTGEGEAADHQEKFLEYNLNSDHHISPPFANIQKNNVDAVNTDPDAKHNAFPDGSKSSFGEKQTRSSRSTNRHPSSIEKKRGRISKDYSSKTIVSDSQHSNRRVVVSASTQTDQAIMKDSAIQATKSNKENNAKDMLEIAQRQLLDHKERLSHYQKKCKSLEETTQSQAQASDLLQKHNASLQAKNRDLFQEQESVNNDLEEALLQLEQTRQQLRLQMATNANLTHAIDQQKSQHEAIVATLEMQNQALLAHQSTLTPTIPPVTLPDVAEVSEKAVETNVFLKKRLEMMRSRVQSRLHNSRENLASIESRAILGLTESRMRIQKLQIELKGLRSESEMV